MSFSHSRLLLQVQFCTVKKNANSSKLSSQITYLMRNLLVEHRKIQLKLFTLSQTQFYTCSIKSSHVTQQYPPSVPVFLSLLHKFSPNLNLVKSIHAQVIVNSFSYNHFVATKLVKTYSELSHLDNARQVFDQIANPETVLCNSLIRGYLRNERYKEVLELFEMMRVCGLDVDSYTCNFVLKACVVLLDYEMGLEVIREAMERGVGDDRFFGSSVLNFLVKFGNVSEARSVFERMPEKDVVCWNTLIGGYVQESCFWEVFDLFLEMRGWGVWPSNVTMANLIQACCGIGNLELAKCVHACVLALGMGGDIMVLTSLVDMYCKLGDISSARLVFYHMPAKNLVTWNAMISGCIQNDLIYEAFGLFHRLITSDGRYDSGTMVSLLQGCTQTADLERGKILHGCILRRGLDMNPILCTAIIDLYSKCAAVNQAKLVFDSMRDKNVITWTAMLVGLSQNGHADEALRLFHRMQEMGVTANSVTITGLVHCCAHLGSLKKGKSVHAHLIHHGYVSNIVHMTALIDMYARCGKIISAEWVFNNGYICKDTILWNSMITGYGMHGHGHHAVGLYRQMIAEGIKANEGTFVSLLTACSHSGLVEEGVTFFQSMERDHDIKPTDKHYACLVDLFSRAGQLEEAEGVISQMPFESSAVFEALLSGCRTHKNLDLGIRAADKLLQLGTTNSSIYILLSNIYAAAKKWDAVNYIRYLMRQKGLAKTPGYSSIEIENQVHTFFAQDDSHENWPAIYRLLEKLRSEVEASGYVPDTSCVLRDVDDSVKVKLLWGHSERLAIAFGLLSTPAGSLIRITKNLRVCVDCHTVTKYITKITKREIIVRDANRFHHFIHGRCSCNDYW